MIEHPKAAFHPPVLLVFFSVISECPKLLVLGRFPEENVSVVTGSCEHLTWVVVSYKSKHMNKRYLPVGHHLTTLTEHVCLMRVVR